MARPTLEFHRPSRDWIQVRCPCGEWSKEPVTAWIRRSKRHGFEYGCGAGKLHPVDSALAVRIRELVEHPGWE